MLSLRTSNICVARRPICVARPRVAIVVRSTPQEVDTQLEKALKEAKDCDTTNKVGSEPPTERHSTWPRPCPAQQVADGSGCAAFPRSQNCASAWDAVEELAAAKVGAGAAPREGLA